MAISYDQELGRWHAGSAKKHRQLVSFAERPSALLNGQQLSLFKDCASADHLAGAHFAY
jgi:hypothetical protein